jgi:hypothetical protein
MTRLLAIIAILTPALFGQEQFINWRTNYKAALQEAAQTKKPIFLEFRCEA